MEGEALGEFCGRFGLQEKNVRESLATSQQLEEIYRKYCGGVEDSYSSVLLPPTEDQETVLLQAILAAFPDQIARRLHFAEAAAMGIKVSVAMLPLTLWPYLYSTKRIEHSNNLLCKGDRKPPCFLVVVVWCLQHDHDRSQQSCVYVVSER